MTKVVYVVAVDVPGLYSREIKFHPPAGIGVLVDRAQNAHHFARERYAKRVAKQYREDYDLPAVVREVTVAGFSPVERSVPRNVVLEFSVN